TRGAERKRGEVQPQCPARRRNCPRRTARAPLHPAGPLRSGQRSLVSSVDTSSGKRLRLPRAPAWRARGPAPAPPAPPLLGERAYRTGAAAAGLTVGRLFIAVSASATLRFRDAR